MIDLILLSLAIVVGLVAVIAPMDTLPSVILCAAAFAIALIASTL